MLDSLGFPPALAGLKTEIKSLLFLDFNEWLADSKNSPDYSELTEDEIIKLYEEYN